MMTVGELKERLAACDDRLPVVIDDGMSFSIKNGLPVMREVVVNWWSGRPVVVLAVGARIER